MNVRPGVGNRRGSVLALVAVCLVVLLGMGGLALDSARGYLVRARLARAVDAGVLAGARSVRLGEDVARQRAIDLARVNGAISAAWPSSLDVSFDFNEFAEQTVRMDGMQRIPTYLMRVLGIDSMTVRAAAVAAVPPVDLVLAIDQSGSLRELGAWDDLQDAAKLFVDNFDENLDQLGLVSFQLRGTERFLMSDRFRTPIRNEIDGMRSIGDTNTGEGLRLAFEQFQAADVRPRSARVVVFFTDGRPTAFRGNLGGRDRMMAVYRKFSNGRLRGYFDDPDRLPTDALGTPDGCRNEHSCFMSWTEDRVRERAREAGLEAAAAIREQGIFIYSIGLGNPNAPTPLEVPDLDYLKLVANEDGVSDPHQPQGKSYFAPSARDLRVVFELVASDLLVRLAQ
ncbi:MAG: VWA domain-containing protein [Gemmatimonadota bacterium]